MKTIRDYLNQTGKSVEDLAASIKVAPSTLYRALNQQCEMRQGTLLKLSRETGISVELLITELGNKSAVNE